MPFSLGYRLLVTGSCHSKVTGILSQQGHKGAKTEQVQKKAFFEIHHLSQSFLSLRPLRPCCELFCLLVAF